MTKGIKKYITVFLSMLVFLTCSACSRVHHIPMEELNGTWYVQTSSKNVPEITFDTDDNSYRALGMAEYIGTEGSFSVNKRTSELELTSKDDGNRAKTVLGIAEEDNMWRMYLQTTIGKLLLIKTPPRAETYESAASEENVQTTISFGKISENGGTETDPEQANVELYAAAVPDERTVQRSMQIRCADYSQDLKYDDVYLCNTVSNVYQVTVYMDEEHNEIADDETIEKYGIPVTFNYNEALLKLAADGKDISSIGVYKYVKDIGVYCLEEIIDEDAEDCSITITARSNGSYVLAIQIAESEEPDYNDHQEQQAYARIVNAFLTKGTWESNENTIEFTLSDGTYCMVLDSGEPMYYSLAKLSGTDDSYKFNFSMEGAGDGVSAILTLPTTKDFSEESGKMVLEITWLNGQTMTFTADYIHLSL